MRFLMPIFVMFVSSTLYANEAPTRNELALIIGKSIFGDDFQQNQEVNTTLTGKDGCKIEVEIRDNFFLLQGTSQTKSALVKPYRPTFVKVKNQNGTQSIYFESVGPCLGGFLPGSASCDNNMARVIVRRDEAGKIQDIELRHRVNMIFQFTDAVKCQF